MKRALIIRQPHIGMILSGLKTWEMRSTDTKIRGLIGLIEAGSGLITGEAEIVSTRTWLTKEQLAYHRDKHRCKDISILEKWRCAWVLKNAKKYDEPIPYKHPKGAVIWVKLDALTP